MQFGHFDDASREYVITRPDTPRPWSNYIGSADFGGVVTNNAAGYTFYRSAAQGRLTRFKFNALPADLNGRFVYLRDQADGDFWSASWMPVGKDLADFQCECRHGTGYTRIQSLYRGIECVVTFFAPPNRLFETWKIEIANTSQDPRHLKAFPFIEPQCNWSADDDMRNLQYNQYISQTGLVDGLIDIGSNVNMPEDPEHFTNKDQKRHTFFGLSGTEPSGFDADLAGFMGPYGNAARPRAVVDGRCSGSTASGDMPAAAFEIDLALEPGQRRCFAVVFGVGRAGSAGKEAAKLMSSEQEIDRALQEVKDYWSRRLQALRVETPDPLFDSMANTWAPFNNLMTFYWSRTASLVYAGERDGLGYRDTLQDLVGSASLVTDESRQRLELMLTGQLAHGGCLPVVQPFNHRPGREKEPDHLRADDGMWLFNAVPAYVKETGDLGFFRQRLPFADKGEATVLEHLRRAIEFNIERSGAHGLPCGLFADWNDCIRLGEKGESVFVAMQLRYALREYREICELLQEADQAAWATERLSALDQTIEEHAWDGQWYLRAFRFDGLKFGSQQSEEGKIFMNPQTWSVLSGLAQGERAGQVMQAMREKLNTEYGIMLCAPPYVTTDPEVCLGRLFNPGTKENGGIFNHTQGWAVMAAASLGQGDQAYEYLSNVMPARFNDLAELRQVEPYVVCQSTHSRFSPRFGTGRVSWLSGSAVWNYVAMSQAILGIQPDYAGLRINPCLPRHWPGYTAQRLFRGHRIHIEVKNPQGICQGVKCLAINGKTIQGNLIPANHLQDNLRVTATLSL